MGLVSDEQAESAVIPRRSRLYGICSGKLENWLPDCVSIVYTSAMDKDVGFRIRIDRNLRERFLEVCRAQDKPAAQVLREFMRVYIETHEPSNDDRRQAATGAKQEGA